MSSWTKKCHIFFIVLYAKSFTFLTWMDTQWSHHTVLFPPFRHRDGVTPGLFNSFQVQKLWCLKTIFDQSLLMCLSKTQLKCLINFKMWKISNNPCLHYLVKNLSLNCRANPLFNAPWRIKVQYLNHKDGEYAVILLLSTNLIKRPKGKMCLSVLSNFPLLSVALSPKPISSY